MWLTVLCRINVLMSRAMSPSESEVVLYPIRLQLRGSPYANHLYDVDGTLLTNASGSILHVYTSLLGDEFASGRLRLLHDIRGGYRYFITSQSQLDRFQSEREHGTPYFRRTYHVYPDEDFDRFALRHHNIHVVN